MSMVATPLVPKDPAGPLKVVAIGRISTLHQDVENIEASHRYIQDYLGHIYCGPIEITLLGEQASGMLTDRATIREAEDLVAGGQVDLMIAEDLARIYRNPRHQYRFVQDCVDQGTRVICVGDNLDTADENWEISMGAAALRHGLHIPDTRRRVRRTATYAFHKGGMVQKIRYGYRRLTVEEAGSGLLGPKDLRIARRPECTPIIRQMMTRVLRGDPYASVAEWLQAEGIEPGAYVESGQWTARLVVGLLDDPILSGTRTFRDTICRPIFRTGKHKPVKNSEPEREHCPELAHLTAEEHDALRQEIARRRAMRADWSDGSSRRRGVPRSRSLWPGQACVCGACGGPMYFCGKYLRCRRSLPRFGGSCWNHVQVPADLARQRICAWLDEALKGEPLMREAMIEAVWEELDRPRRRSIQNRPNPGREIAALERQAANLAAAIAEGGQLQTLLANLKTVEAALEKARAAKAAATSEMPAVEIGPSKQDVERSLGERMGALAGESFEFAGHLRRIFPRFVVQPVQALDTPQIKPRGKLLFRPSAIVPGGASADQHPATADQELAIDLFEPPLHLRWLTPCKAARQGSPRASLDRLAEALGIHRMTVKRAIDYLRRMEQAGTSDPYLEVSAPPRDASRWRERPKPDRGARRPEMATI
jgi:DNA invertase Pin-like site-specific DNA recombinase